MTPYGTLLLDKELLSKLIGLPSCLHLVHLHVLPNNMLSLLLTGPHITPNSTLHMCYIPLEHAQGNALLATGIIINEHKGVLHHEYATEQNRKNHQSLSTW